MSKRGIPVLKSGDMYQLIDSHVCQARVLIHISGTVYRIMHYISKIKHIFFIIIISSAKYQNFNATTRKGLTKNEKQFICAKNNIGFITQFVLQLNLKFQMVLYIKSNIKNSYNTDNLHRSTFSNLLAKCACMA